MSENFISSVSKQFEYYKSLGEKTFDQLSDKQLFWQINESSNSVAVIVNHLWGNMLSRWTDFLTADGEKEWRDRDLEFENVIDSREALNKKWDEGWACLFKAINSVNEENFDQLIYIRSKGHSIVEAVNRQLAHYAYHIGQIVFIGKQCASDDWNSLSIPKGQSKQYNKESFDKGKRVEHFTEQFIDKKDQSK